MKQEKISNLINIILELARIGDEDVLLEKILQEARRFTNADAGSIYIKRGNELLFRCTQNDTLSKNLPVGKKLIYSTFSVPVNHKSISGYVASTGESLNIPDVYNLARGVPYKFRTVYDDLSNYRTKSMFTTPLISSRNKIIGVLQLINAKNSRNEIISFPQEDVPLIKLFANLAATSFERAQLTRMTILRMISMAELRDPQETGAHANRVGAYSMEIYETWAKRRNINPSEIEHKKDMLRMAAMLHDVGKIAIPDNILKKPGKFTADEFNIIKTHTTLGGQLFTDSTSEIDEMAATIALTHHEKWDGSGYPKGLKGDEIPLMGRIVAVADVYDALCSKRSYKEAMADEKACEILRKGAGKDFDPEIIDCFFESIDIIREISKRYREET